MHTKHEGIANTWKCRFTRQGNYVVVFEWDSLDVMRKTLGEVYGKGCPPKYYDDSMAAAHIYPTCTHFPYGRKCIPKKFGEIHVAKDNYGTRTVAHEVQHIINWYVNSKDWHTVDNDEQIAKIAGELTRVFWRGYYKIYDH